MGFRRRVRSRCLPFALFALLAALSACDNEIPEPPEPQVAKTDPLRGNINVAIHSDQPGWGYTTNGFQYSGFDYDLGNWLGGEIGFNPTWIGASAGQRDDLLINGKVKLVLATYSITDERKKTVSFAGPYIVTQQGILVRTGYKKINKVADFAGKSACAVLGTTSLAQLEGQMDKKRITAEQGLSTCVERLLKGDVEMVSTDQLVLRGYASKNPDKLAVVEGLTFGYKEMYGVGLPHGNGAYCQEITAALKRFIESGAWDNFFRKHFPGIPDSDQYRPDPGALDPCPAT
ncbi:ABC transporter substrate-binding protein [Paractinoplanes rishiriensis]|uniref:ABC transporter substrate-binding protein n=2 Tax=Paractinoplanes rishiriensis TaxID=1050105 RepID=A0A919K947_9ACTN|nr:ABC transporter substrate-binding protein [Actinoplanes rishiriensis]